jgi:hypothetical protein
MSKKIIQQKFKASTIIITFFVMLLILSIGLSLALVTLKDMKGSIGSSKSNYAYQAADEGVEVVMFELLKGGKTKVNEIMPAYCSGGLIKKDNYVVELLDGATSQNRIVCNSPDSVLISDVKYIKSIGVSKDNAQKSERAVKVPVNCRGAGC